MVGESDKLVSGIDHPFWYRMGNTDVERRDGYRKYLLSEAEQAKDKELFRGNSAIIGTPSFTINFKQEKGRLSSRKAGYPRNINAK